MNSLEISDWRPDPGHLSLEEGSIHVWRIDLDRFIKDIHTYMHFLSSDERERAAKFRFDLNRNHFIIRRGILRSLISRYLSDHPGKVSLSQNPFGKPILWGEHANALFFNGSKSGKWTLIALSKNIDLGVDIEDKNQEIDFLNIVNRFFSPVEKSEFLSLSNDARREAFFLGWTRKEAYLKCNGSGLSIPLAHFSVELSPGQPPRLLSPHDPEDSASNWLIADIPAAADYCAALAARTTNPVIEYYDY